MVETSGHGKEPAICTYRVKKTENEAVRADNEEARGQESSWEQKLEQEIPHHERILPSTAQRPLKSNVNRLGTPFLEVRSPTKKKTKLAVDGSIVDSSPSVHEEKTPRARALTSGNVACAQMDPGKVPVRSADHPKKKFEKDEEMLAKSKQQETSGEKITHCEPT